MAASIAKSFKDYLHVGFHGGQVFFNRHHPAHQPFDILVHRSSSVFCHCKSLWLVCCPSYSGLGNFAFAAVHFPIIASKSSGKSNTGSRADFNAVLLPALISTILSIASATLVCCILTITAHFKMASSSLPIAFCQPPSPPIVLIISKSRLSLYSEGLGGGGGGAGSSV